jgi:hypothetical protein
MQVTLHIERKDGKLKAGILEGDDNFALLSNAEQPTETRQAQYESEQDIMKIAVKLVEALLWGQKGEA